MRYPAADPKNLVYTDEFGIRGSNYYWHNAERFNISKAELAKHEIVDVRVRVDKAIIEPLKSAQKTLNKSGYDIVIVDGYRSPELYQLAYKKRAALHGKDNADSLMNLDAMPHASGRTVDIDLVDVKTGEKIEMRSREDGVEACFVDFYRGKDDPKSQQYQRLQDLLLGTMKSLGFVLGSKKEYWHFELPHNK